MSSSNRDANSTNRGQTPGSSLGQSSSQKEKFPVRLSLDPKIAGLAGIYLYGPRAVAAVMMGLSRPVRPTAEGVSTLIDQWERGDENCCYQGSMSELFSLTDTIIFAISYRHAEKEDWSRKGADRRCKLRACDEDLLKLALENYGRVFPRVMLWCDQILTTRLYSIRSDFDQEDFRWYHVGLLPYSAFLVLQLSSHIPEEELEDRVWIRAERSLGRNAYGIIKADEAARNVLLGHPSRCMDGWKCMMLASSHVLSGYWPQPDDRDHWRPEYDRMKIWFLGISCRGNTLNDRTLFHEHDKVDNTEILSSFGEFAVPWGKSKEHFIFTEDKEFYLKASAWNLFLRSTWEKNTRYISHYMGRMEDTRFSWWQCEKHRIVFGCIVFLLRSATILAIETNEGYRLFRAAGDWQLYVHAESIAGPNTKEQIRQAAESAGVELHQDLEWQLLYCNDSTDPTEIRTRAQILSALKKDKGQTTQAEVMVAPIFGGTTTQLFNCAIAKSGSEPEEVARKICECVSDWNQHVKSSYPEYMSVRDTTLGPVWLEGYNNKKLSFGFLEFLTNALVLNRRYISENSVDLADPANVITEVTKLSPEMTMNERCLAAEFFENIDGDETKQLSRRDVVRFVLCGGFARNCRRYVLSRFFTSLSRSRKYWQTMVFCRGGAMQIRFANAAGEKRIAQRRTTLQKYSANGVVRPDDYEKVRKLSVPYDTSNDEYLMMAYWNEMEDTTTREEMWQVLSSSKRTFEGREVLLVDMTVWDGEDGRGMEDKSAMHHTAADPIEMNQAILSGDAAKHFNSLVERLARLEVTAEQAIKELHTNIGAKREAALKTQNKEEEH